MTINPGAQSGFPYEALVTFIMLPVFVGEVHIMCAPAPPPYIPRLENHLVIVALQEDAQINQVQQSCRTVTLGAAYGWLAPLSGVMLSERCTAAFLAALHVCNLPNRTLWNVNFVLSAPGMPRRCRDQAIRGMLPRRLFPNPTPTFTTTYLCGTVTSAPGMPRRCRDQAIRGMLPRRLFANVAAALSSAADSFPLPMPPSGRRMGGLAACMAVHAFTQARSQCRPSRWPTCAWLWVVSTQHA